MSVRGLTEKIDEAAEATVNSNLDRFPPLVVYTCLAGAQQALAASALLSTQMCAPATSEILTMPRRTFGTRPIEVLSPTSRTVYNALVAVLGDSLVKPTRGHDAWEAHREFGRVGTHEYVVELDFASCYELLNHEDLREELLLRSLDFAAVGALMDLLAGVGHRGRGLPQMLAPSDRLADTYLSVIDREMARTGYRANRFADDVRVLAGDWESANAVIEHVAEVGRGLGLILSSEKTKIWLTETLRQQEDRREAALVESFSDAADELTELVFDPYGDVVDILAPDRDSVLVTASKRVLEAWAEAFGDDSESAQRLRVTLKPHVSFALSVLGRQSVTLNGDLLDDLIFDDETRLQSVCRYVVDLHRTGSTKDARQLLSRLTMRQRQSPWGKLWVLSAAESFGYGPRSISKETRIWLSRQLQDGHEVVRAQAAWLLACRGALTDAELERSYRKATEVSAHALAAAAAKQSNLPTGLVAAIRDENRLNLEAYRWAL